MTIPRGVYDVVDVMVNVPDEHQREVAETARDAWDGYLQLLDEEEEETANV